MTPRSFLLALCTMSALFLLFFHAYQQRLSDPWEQLVLNPEFRQLLMRNMNNERKLSTLEPEKAEFYKEHFAKTQSLLAHLEILETNRHKITQRYNLFSLALFGLSLITVVGIFLIRRRRMEAQLEIIGGYLSRLALGETDLHVPPTGHGVIGRIGEMIGTTSTVLTRATARVKALENLEAWQESSRRMAHEIRTPLTTLRLEVDKLVRATLKVAPEAAPQLSQLEKGIREEMAQLSTFTDQYTSFAKIGKPHPKPNLLSAFVQEFVEIYAHAWENLNITRLNSQIEHEPEVLLDKRLIRQVLVNLCNNSSKALGKQSGTVGFSLSLENTRLTLYVADDGPGIPESIRDRLFQPYATTSEVGEGTGLGLAISRKIMLDHGGDLTIDTSRANGATFSLLIPIPDTEEAA